MTVFEEYTCLRVYLFCRQIYKYPIKYCLECFSQLENVLCYIFIFLLKNKPTNIKKNKPRYFGNMLCNNWRLIFDQWCVVFNVLKTSFLTPPTKNNCHILIPPTKNYSRSLPLKQKQLSTNKIIFSSHFPSHPTS